VSFVHGDIRNPEDFEPVGPVDLVIDCAAEPSVQAGLDGQARYLVATNLVGTFNSLEFARRHDSGFILLSTSRVYSIESLRALPLEAAADRLALAPGSTGPGWSERGIQTGFPTAGARSLYGTTKLASELLVEEYGALYSMPRVVNRCGVITGPWQMGKVDQGFFVLWAARHLFRRNLTYTGFGGTGRQVRDVLHADDLAALIRTQIARLDALNGGVFNAGGGAANAVSLRELTALCAGATGVRIEIGSVAETNVVDVPWYVSDNAAVGAATGWRPERGIEAILDDVLRWLRDNRALVAPVLDPPAPR
jgi:CDP-paratose 2-epimerase